ncbi:amino acid adenylation protein [Myxococcus stipitatus DSM 14675]|uniref:Amino acid adenylation protein n=1 Tax=Myxococcus stipitatus (strain DSM 14675 / JCM 12634 / Mx s8) TaxID=1278073 RepID=L7U3P4_MYXSD|nr:non-ribosomal peptide synthetase [Myxococcus stipitatus]AGC43391.1 amino acid adenylation protein [Myxococcus stipitatus DSM 14675]
MTSPSGFRLSPQQLRLWSLLREGPAWAYRARCVLELEGTVDAASLEHTVRELLGRHEILRTTYHPLTGTSTAIQAPGNVPASLLTRHDWSGLSEAERAAKLDALFSATEADLTAFERASALHLATVTPHQHLLVMDLPALNADASTLGLVARELAQVHAARANGGPVSSADVQYADVSEVFNEVLESEDTAAGRRHWQDRDLSAPLAAALPTRRSAPGAQPFQPRHVHVTLSASTRSAVEAAAGRLDVPVPAFLLAAWQTLLGRLSGRSEWTVAVRYEGRTYEGLADAAGHFERFVPLAAEYPERSRFVDFARSVARAMQEGVEWQEYFDASRSMQGQDGKPRHFPFAFEHLAWPAEISEGGLTVRVHRLESRTERFELKLAALQRGASLELQLQHDASAYTDSEATRLLERLETLLGSAASASDETLDTLPLMGERELRQLAGFNHTERARPPARCIHELLDEQTQRTPGAVAVVFEDQRLTFAELSARANQLARHLRRIGVGPETRVGLLLERSVDAMVGLFGILKAGAAYVPMDAMYPRERLASILTQSDAPFLVTSTPLGALLPEGLTRLIRLDADAGDIAREQDTAPEPLVGPDHLAYVLFTSGSTGRPKGVMIQHRSVVNLAAALQEAVYGNRGPGLRVSVNAPLVFDASVKQWIQLLHGHTLHIIPEEVRPDAGRLCEYVRTHRLDVLDCTPSLLVPLVAKGLGSDPESSPSLVLVGGEAIDPRTWTELARRERTRFVNVYGPTECTVDATACAAHESLEPTIGGPLGNMRVHLLDRNQRPVPVGAVGELFIGGAGVGRGYASAPELTAERFVPDPFGVAPGARLYRTGDLGRFREDGRVDFLGRADHQVKLRGFRIELGEIESLMRVHPEVGETVVVVRETAAGDAHLAGYFVPRRGLPAGSEGAGRELATQLRGFLREMLPEYMVPSALVPLDRMPLTRNGKLDRAALPDPKAVLADAAPYIAPGTAVESTIADIWREALKVDRVGLHSNFFDLGGHSLLMVQVHEKLSAAFGRRLSMVELFQHPTVASLSKYLQQTQQPEAGARSREVQDERARKQRQAMQQQAQAIKAGRVKR